MMGWLWVLLLIGLLAGCDSEGDMSDPFPNPSAAEQQGSTGGTKVPVIICFPRKGNVCPQ